MSAPLQYLCRSCFHHWQAESRDAPPKNDNVKNDNAKNDNMGDKKISLCPLCQSPKLIAHAELFDLSIAHLDCDSFYTSVEKRDRPEIATKPVIVGGRERGVVAAACYVARIYGVRSAMPMFQALKKCPQAVVIPPDMAKYKAAGYKIRQAMRQVSAKIEPLSIDEAYLDLSDNVKLHKEPPCVSLAKLAASIEMREKISVSIGLSYNKFLAKLASDMDKPKGFYTIGKEEAKDFLAELPVRKLWGVGPQSADKMMKYGYMTIGHVQAAKPEDLMRIFGKAGYGFYLFANGEDNRRISPESKTKSISAETTFSQDLTSLNELSAQLASLCEQVARRLKAQRLLGHVVVIKLKDNHFKNSTRSKKHAVGFQDAAEIRQAAEVLLHDYWRDVGAQKAEAGGFRLLGVGIADLFAEHAEAPDMFEFSADSSDTAPIKTKEELASAVKDIKKKFGDGAIGLRDKRET